SRNMSQLGVTPTPSNENSTNCGGVSPGARRVIGTLNGGGSGGGVGCGGDAGAAVGVPGLASPGCDSAASDVLVLRASRNAMPPTVIAQTAAVAAMRCGTRRA